MSAAAAEASSTINVAVQQANGTKIAMCVTEPQTIANLKDQLALKAEVVSIPLQYHNSLRLI